MSKKARKKMGVHSRNQARRLLGKQLPDIRYIGRRNLPAPASGAKE